MVAIRLLTASALMLGAALPASAQTGTTPASRFTGWLCEIDLAGAGLQRAGAPASVFATDTLKLCSGSASSQNVKIECNAAIPGWTGGKVDAKGFPCQVFLGQCGLPGFAAAEVSSLTIDASGAARLTCLRSKDSAASP